MKSSTLCTVLAIALLGGCPSTLSCPAGTMFVGGICLAGDAGPPEEDAGPEVDAPEPPDAPMDDAGPCGVCDALTPFCDTTGTPTCVECLSPLDCDAGSLELACVAGACEQCDDNVDCPLAATSSCDTATNTCVSCTTDADCSHLTDTTVCDDTGVAGVCVECNAADETACGANSCDPATFTCTTTPRTSVRRCGACLADSECMNADDRCVPMDFMGATRAGGGFCLKQGDMGGCVAPFGVPTPARASLSGAAAEVYCGVNEGVTTCDAILDLGDGTTCTTDDDCGAAGLADGQCETVNLMANRCTYACSSSTFCPSGFSCPSMTYCGSP